MQKKPFLQDIVPVIIKRDYKIPMRYLQPTHSQLHNIHINIPHFNQENKGFCCWKILEFHYFKIVMNSQYKLTTCSCLSFMLNAWLCILYCILFRFYVMMLSHLFFHTSFAVTHHILLFFIGGEKPKSLLLFCFLTFKKNKKCGIIQRLLLVV